MKTFLDAKKTSTSSLASSTSVQVLVDTEKRTKAEIKRQENREALRFSWEQLEKMKQDERQQESEKRTKESHRLPQIKATDPGICGAFQKFLDEVAKLACRSDFWSWSWNDTYGEYRGIQAKDMDKFGKAKDTLFTTLNSWEKAKYAGPVPREVDVQDSAYITTVKKAQFNKNIDKVIQLRDQRRKIEAEAISYTYCKKREHQYQIVKKINDDRAVLEQKVEQARQRETVTKSSTEESLSTSSGVILDNSEVCLNCEDIQQLASIVDQCEYLDRSILDTRLDLIKTVESYTPQELELLPKSNQGYTLSTESKQLLEELDIDSKVFEACNGDEVQQKVYQEFVSIIDLSSMIYEKARSADVKELVYLALEFSETGNVCDIAL